MIRVVVDGTADIPEDLCAAYGISVVPILAQFGDETFRDGVDISKDEFYRRLVEGGVTPKTAAPPIGAFLETYTRLTADGASLVSIHVAGKLSGTIASARQAAAMLPAARIAIVDSGSVAAPLAFMAMASVRAAREGQSLEAVVSCAEDVGRRSFLYVGLETLKYIERSGRIGKARALMGALLNVKPMLEVRDGEIHPLEHARTTKRMLARLAELTQSRLPLAELWVLYTFTRDLADSLTGLIVEAGIFPRERIRTVQMSGVIGTHAGPTGVAVAGVARDT